MLVVEGALAAALEREARLVAPREAVGLLTAQGEVINLRNLSSDPESNFAISKEDVLSAIRKHEIDDVAGLTLWHSHPSGGVGPSRVDMQQRLPYFEHLVVTLHATNVEFTWY